MTYSSGSVVGITVRLKDCRQSLTSNPPTLFLLLRRMLFVLGFLTSITTLRIAVRVENRSQSAACNAPALLLQL